MPASTRVLLTPELLENILGNLRDDLAIPQRVCRTWHDLIHSSASIGLYKAYQRSTLQYQKRSSIDSDLELEFPIVYYNLQTHIFPEDIWYLSPFMRVKFSPKECLVFALRKQPFTSTMSILRNDGDVMATPPMVRAFRFNLEYSGNVRPSWRDMQFSYPATTHIRFRMADIIRRPSPILLRTTDNSARFSSAQIRDALQFQVVCETGITYGQIADAFARNHERKHLEHEPEDVAQWKLRLPSDSGDLTTFTYSMEYRSSTFAEKSDVAEYNPKINEGETVRSIVEQHKEVGWALVNLVDVMNRRRHNLRHNPVGPSLPAARTTSQ